MYFQTIIKKIDSVFAGGRYSAFGGRDASRGLATFKVTSSDTEEYDDLSDLDTMEMDSVREWEMQFKGNKTNLLKSLPVDKNDEKVEINE